MLMFASNEVTTSGGGILVFGVVFVWFGMTVVCDALGGYVWEWLL